MIAIKTKSGIVNNNAFVEVVKWEEKNTNTYEHLCIIQELIIEILDNDKTMNEKELFDLIKNNVNKSLKDR